MTAEATRSRQPKPLAAGVFQGTISSFRLHLAAEGKSGKTERTYTEAVQLFADAHLLRETSHCDWDQVGAHDLQSWMAWLLGRYSGSHASNQDRALQQFFRWWSDEEELPDRWPGSIHPGRKLVPVFTSGELAILERACRGRTFAQRRDYAIICVSGRPASGYLSWPVSVMTRTTRSAATLTYGSARSPSEARAASRGSSGSAVRLPAVLAATSGSVPDTGRRTGRSCGWG
jgi:Phage integrase, N-terminal SAM-like domain